MKMTGSNEPRVLTTIIFWDTGKLWPGLAWLRNGSAGVLRRRSESPSTEAMTICYGSRGRHRSSMVCQKCDVAVEWDCLSALNGSRMLLQASGTAGTDGGSLEMGPVRSLRRHTSQPPPAWRALQLATPSTSYARSLGQLSQSSSHRRHGDRYPLLLPPLPMHSYREIRDDDMKVRHTYMTPPTHTPAIHLSGMEKRERTQRTHHAQAPSAETREYRLQRKGVLRTPGITAHPRQTLSNHHDSIAR
jgi:hypothetical protein